MLVSFYIICQHEQMLLSQMLVVICNQLLFVIYFAENSLYENTRLRRKHYKSAAQHINCLYSLQQHTAMRSTYHMRAAAYVLVLCCHLSLAQPHNRALLVDGARQPYVPYTKSVWFCQLSRICLAQFSSSVTFAETSLTKDRSLW